MAPCLQMIAERNRVKNTAKEYLANESFMHGKPIEVTFGFNLRVMKKSARWLCHTEKSKTNIKKLISPLLTRTQGSQGCQKMRQDPLNMPHEVWCANIAPKLKNIQKTLRKQGFLMIFFQF